jgi:hypothetical protein
MLGRVARLYASGCSQFQIAPNNYPVTKPAMKVTTISVAAITKSKAVIVYGG